MGDPGAWPDLRSTGHCLQSSDMTSLPLRSIHVVAGLITDPRGRILLARRMEGRDLAGRWEFPGGKCEPGETSEQALARELHEELGIAVDVGEWLMEVPQLYPDKRLRLEVRRINAWQGGPPRGVEGQALLWVPLEKLERYVMPPADRPVVGFLLQPDRYLVTPEPVAGDDAGWLQGLEQAIRAGIRRVQLRLHIVDGDRRESLLSAAVELCRQSDVQVLLNGDAALARELGTGLHLRSAQLVDMDARPDTGGALLGASCHNADDLRRAEALGCDFAVLGPVQDTPTHPGAPVLGWEGFDRLRETVSLPIYAIGGLGPDDIGEARRHGAQGVAAIRSLWPR